MARKVRLVRKAPLAPTALPVRRVRKATRVMSAPLALTARRRAFLARLVPTVRLVLRDRPERMAR
jgi:hypothetical protein